MRVGITETRMVEEQKYMFSERLVSYQKKILNKLQHNIDPAALQKKTYTKGWITTGLSRQGMSIICETAGLLNVVVGNFQSQFAVMK